jgi:hypothetical protein
MFTINRVDGMSDTAGNELQLTNNEWDVFTHHRFLPALLATQSRSLILESGTGTGKTFWFPQSVQKNHFVHTGFYCRHHIIMVPTRILAQETHIPGCRWVRRRAIDGQNVGPGIQEGINIMTYGYAKAIWSQIETLANTTTLLQYDEFHFQDPSQIWCYHKAASQGYYKVVSTATPELPLMHESITSMSTNFPPRHTVHTIILDAFTNPTDAFDGLMRSQLATDKGLNARILVIEPSLRECEKICNSLRENASRYPHNFQVNVLHAGDRRVPATGHIVATQMVNAGITIDGVTCVISSGREVVNHKGTVQTVACNAATFKQQKGRTGRTNEGLFIQCLPGARARHSTVVQLPNVWEGLHDLEGWNAAGKYNLRSNITTIPHSDELTDNRITSFLDFTGVSDDTFKRCAKAWWEILCSHSQLDTEQALAATTSAYDSLARHMPSESVEHLDDPGMTWTPADTLLTHFHNGDFSFAVHHEGETYKIFGARPVYVGSSIQFNVPMKTMLEPNAIGYGRRDDIEPVITAHLTLFYPQVNHDQDTAQPEPHEILELEVA